MSSGEPSSQAGDTLPPEDDPWAEEDGDHCNMYTIKMATARAAAENGDITNLPSLLKDWTDDIYFLNDLLFLTASGGHLDCLKLVLENGACPDFWDSKTDETVLSVACSKGHTDIVAYLVQNVESCNVELRVRGDMHTPLHAASKTGQTDCVQVLLDRGVDVDVRDSFGYTPLMFASKGGFPDVVKILLGAGAKADLKTRIRKETAFCFAMEGEHAECVRLLLVACPEDAENNFRGGLLPLHHVIRGQKVEVACSIIDAGVDVNKPDGLWTPLHLALEVGNPMLVRILMDCGAEVNTPLPLPKEVTLLMLAVCKNSKVMVETLCRHPTCNSDQFDELGRTALYLAAKFGYEDCAAVLISEGADVDAYAQHMLEVQVSQRVAPAATPIHAAIMYDQPRVAVTLIGAGCDVEKSVLYQEDSTSSEFNPIQVACVKNVLWALKMLLETPMKLTSKIANWCSHLGQESEMSQYLQDALACQKDPTTLKKLTRQYIRQALGRDNLYSKVASLEIPAGLMDYLLYKDLLAYIPTETSQPSP